MSDKSNKQHAEQVSGGVFLIGLALLFLLDFWWPGIMFVIGASIIARTLAEGKEWTKATGAFWVIGIGLVFWLPDVLNIDFSNLWAFILIGIGLFMLFGGQYRPKMSRHDEHDEYSEDAT